MLTRNMFLLLFCGILLVLLLLNTTSFSIIGVGSNWGSKANVLTSIEALTGSSLKSLGVSSNPCTGCDWTTNAFGQDYDCGPYSQRDTWCGPDGYCANGHGNSQHCKKCCCTGCFS